MFIGRSIRVDILIVTPEKWDSISRGWQRRSYVQRVQLVVIDEIHLLGVDRGPVLVSATVITYIELHFSFSNDFSPTFAFQAHHCVFSVIHPQEVLVSRMRFISTQTDTPIRFVGLSTALANPRDLADWLGECSESVTRLCSCIVATC